MRNAFSIFLIASLFLLLVFPALAAPNDSSFIKGLNNAADKTGGAGYSEVVSPMETIAKLVGKALTPMFIGVTFLIIMLYAGFVWMMARGNEQDVEKAKNIIIYAVIGLVVVLAAYAIVKLILPIWFQSISVQGQN